MRLLNNGLRRAIVLGVMSLHLFACSNGGSSGGGTPPAGSTPTPTASPTLTVSSPSTGASVPAGPVTVTFTTQNFTIGGAGESRMQVTLDDDPIPYTFLNGTSNSIFYNGAPVSDPQWISTNSFRFANLASGLHKLRLALVDSTGKELANPQAVATVAFSVGVSFPTDALVTSISPAAGAVVPGPVTVTFTTTNHTIGLDGTPHLHFYVDGDSIPHEFFNGPGIDEINGVQYKNAHTHFVHWQSPTSFILYGWAPGPHQIRFVLADASHGELTNPEATHTLTFSISGASGSSEFLLEPVINGVAAAGMDFAPGDKLFYADGQSGDGINGAVWIIDTAGGNWARRSIPFYQTAVGTVGEQGLTGVAVDPNYATNGFVYIYFTTPSGTTNRLVRVKDVNGQATQETILIDNLLAADQHNGGVLLFGPDGKLYLTVGEATQQILSQDLSSRNGKILRLNPDGSVPPDNPFPGSYVWSSGWRNSFGLAFHPATGDLWATENGPAYDDEVNRVVKGGNYGWPLVTGVANNPQYIDPIYVLNPPVGITNIAALAPTPVYPAVYHNNLYFTDFVGGKIRRLVLDPTFKTLASDSVVFDGGAGGLVPLKQGPDGYLYISGPGAIYRIILNPNAPR